MKLKEKYLTDEHGNKIGVFLDLEDYQKILDALDELDAIRAYDEAINDDEIPFEEAIAEIEKKRS